jgi:hypothetical protein
MMADWKCRGCGEVIQSGVYHKCHGIITELQSSVVDPYSPLLRVFDLALEQASKGKGAQRHGQGQPFDEQPMMEIGRMVGAGFCFGQAMKKTQEASRMEPEAAKREILGAINYLAGAYLLLDERGDV